MSSAVMIETEAGASLDDCSYFDARADLRIQEVVETWKIVSRCCGGSCGTGCGKRDEGRQGCGKEKAGRKSWRRRHWKEILDIVRKTTLGCKTSITKLWDELQRFPATFCGLLSSRTLSRCSPHLLPRQLPVRAGNWRGGSLPATSQSEQLPLGEKGELFQRESIGSVFLRRPGRNRDRVLQWYRRGLCPPA